MRTHNNDALRKGDVGKQVTLAGWVNSRRDHGSIIFIDLRDRYGMTQVVFDPDFNKNHMEIADKLRREDCIMITGEVKGRRDGMANSNLGSGDIEVFVSELKIVNKAVTPPIEIDDRAEASEEVRLKYRYLDLRRPIMQKRLLFRHNVAQAARKHFLASNFMEIETPVLVKPTPEGARDYLVPSRVHPGKAYALPQSPQLYKQLLMVAGFDNYFQFAKCLRDEDLRQDRQPEHTQMDLEMSFVTADEIRSFVEGLYKTIFKDALGVDIQTPFKTLSYAESVEKYGCDKPDLRYDLELTDVSEIVKDSDFGVFKDVVTSGGIVKCINPQKELGRKEIDAYIKYCQQVGAKGMAWMRVTENGLESNIAKFFNEDHQKRIIEAVGAKAGSVLMFIADKKGPTNDVLDKLRRKLAQDLGLITENTYNFVWINDFPLFAYNEDEDRWEAEHHMFSMPKDEFVDDFEKRPGEVLGNLWDLVFNGVEMGSGSIRVSNPEVQERIMNFVGFDKEAAHEKFGFLLDAYQYGGPIHGGMGLGLDRLVAMMQGLTDIREVIAFPKNKNAVCPMDGSPSQYEDAQLAELNIELSAAAKAALEKEKTKQEEAKEQ